MKRYGGYSFVVKRHTSLLIALLPIPMTCGSACAIEKHLTGFIIILQEVELIYALNNSKPLFGGLIVDRLMELPK